SEERRVGEKRKNWGGGANLKKKKKKKKQLERLVKKDLDEMSKAHADETVKPTLSRERKQRDEGARYEWSHICCVLAMNMRTCRRVWCSLYVYTSRLNAVR